MTLRDPDRSLVRLIQDIKRKANVGHSYEVITDPDDRGNAGKFGIDGDGPFHIDEIRENGELVKALRSGLYLLRKSKHDVSNQHRAKDGKWDKSGHPNTVQTKAETKNGRGLEVARMLQVLDVPDLYDSSNTSYSEALRISKEYYEKELEGRTVDSPAFNGEKVKFLENGYSHTKGDHQPNMSEGNQKRRLKLLPKAKAVLETTPFIDELRPNRELDGATEYGLLGRFADGTVVRVTVEEVTEGNKTFLGVYDWEDVSKKLKREFRPNPAPSGNSSGVGTAPPASSQDNLTKSVVLRKSKNDIEYNYLLNKSLRAGLLDSNKFTAQTVAAGISNPQTKKRIRIGGRHEEFNVTTAHSGKTTIPNTGCDLLITISDKCQNLVSSRKPSHNTLHKSELPSDTDKLPEQNDLNKSDVRGYITHTGRRVNGYCRNCGEGSIFDYKTDHYEDGTKHSYKECRCCGDKVVVHKRTTKQQAARREKSDELESLMDELLNKAHVAEYDRVTASGALAHVMAHEDSRVRHYGNQLRKVKNHADLHKVRQERFAHLPHWGSRFTIMFEERMPNL